MQPFWIHFDIFSCISGLFFHTYGSFLDNSCNQIQSSILLCIFYCVVCLSQSISLKILFKSHVEFYVNNCFNNILLSNISYYDESTFAQGSVLTLNNHALDIATLEKVLIQGQFFPNCLRQFQIVVSVDFLWNNCSKIFRK